MMEKIGCWNRWRRCREYCISIDACSILRKVSSSGFFLDLYDQGKGSNFPLSSFVMETLNWFDGQAITRYVHALVRVSTGIAGSIPHLLFACDTVNLYRPKKFDYIIGFQENQDRSYESLGHLSEEHVFLRTDHVHMSE